MISVPNNLSLHASILIYFYNSVSPFPLQDTTPGQMFRVSLFSDSLLLGLGLSSDGAKQLQVRFILRENCPPFRVNKAESRAERLHFHFLV